jgi:hypothetical protein
MPQVHDHKYKIGDPAALKALVDKLDLHGAEQKRRNRLMKAVKKAEDIAKSAADPKGAKGKKKYTSEEVAFYHGLLTGYSVALRIW